MDKWIVHKFGGSSVADADCFHRVADIIEASPNHAKPWCCRPAAASRTPCSVWSRWRRNPTPIFLPLSRR